MKVFISKHRHNPCGIFDTLANPSANPITDTIEAVNFYGALEKFKPGEWHLTRKAAERAVSVASKPGIVNG